MASTSRANSSKELSGHRASSKKQFHAGGATPGAVTGHRDITGRGHAIHFALLPWLCREGGREEEEEAQQTGRKKALYPQIVYLLIRENNWVEFIISRVPARARSGEHRRMTARFSFFVCSSVREGNGQAGERIALCSRVSLCVHVCTRTHTQRRLRERVLYRRYLRAIPSNGRYISRRSEKIRDRMAG